MLFPKHAGRGLHPAVQRAGEKAAELGQGDAAALLRGEKAQADQTFNFRRWIFCRLVVACKLHEGMKGGSAFARCQREERRFIGTLSSRVLSGMEKSRPPGGDEFPGYSLFRKLGSGQLGRHGGKGQIGDRRRPCAA